MEAGESFGQRVTLFPASSSRLFVSCSIGKLLFFILQVTKSSERGTGNEAKREREEEEGLYFGGVSFVVRTQAFLAKMYHAIMDAAR